MTGVQGNKTDQRRHKSRPKDCIVESNLLILISLLSLTNTCRICRFSSPPFLLHPILRLSKENGAADRLHTTDSTYTQVHKTRGWKEPNKKIIQSRCQNPKPNPPPPFLAGQLSQPREPPSSFEAKKTKQYLQDIMGSLSRVR